MGGTKKEQGPTLVQGITHTEPNLLAVRTHLAQIFLAHSQSNPVSTEQAASTQEAPAIGHLQTSAGDRGLFPSLSPTKSQLKPPTAQKHEPPVLFGNLLSFKQDAGCKCLVNSDVFDYCFLTQEEDPRLASR